VAAGWTPAALARAVDAGEAPEHDVLDALPASDREPALDALLRSPAGRRWLRMYPHLDAPLADRLLECASDFRQRRRDASLARAVERASEVTLIRHVAAIGAGPAGPALWSRFAADPDRVVELASRVVRDDEAAGGEAALYLLVLDPIDTYQLGMSRRSEIAAAALSSPVASVRGLATEHLAQRDPRRLLLAFDALIEDQDERVRGLAWSTALRHAREATTERALARIGDERAATSHRRSALLALGDALPRADMVDVLSFMVTHPDPRLATDAANLLDSLHRNPLAAEAARASPHANVREIAERLLDPLRGSPAAGGSRPGDPTRTADIYADMILQLEDRLASQPGPASDDDEPLSTRG
jgi:hypothetical protein